MFNQAGVEAGRRARETPGGEQKEGSCRQERQQNAGYPQPERQESGAQQEIPSWCRCLRFHAANPAVGSRRNYAWHALFFQSRSSSAESL